MLIYPSYIILGLNSSVLLTDVLVLVYIYYAYNYRPCRPTQNWRSSLRKIEALPFCHLGGFFTSICNFCTVTKLQTRLLIIFQWEAPHSRPRETDMLPKRGNRWRGNKQIPSSHRWPGNKYEALVVLIFGEIWAAVLHERFKEGYRCDGKGSEKMNFDVDRLVDYTSSQTMEELKIAKDKDRKSKTLDCLLVSPKLFLLKQQHVRSLARLVKLWTKVRINQYKLHRILQIFSV